MRILGLCAVLATATLPLLAQDDPVRQVLSVRAGIGPAMRAKEPPRSKRSGLHR
jgi:hypothetical protein